MKRIAIILCLLTAVQSNKVFAEIMMDRIDIQPEHQSCVEDSDCTSVETLCKSTGCECGTPINKAFVKKYVAMVAACRASGRLTQCQMSCPLQSQSCVENLCVKSEIVSPPLSLELSAQKNNYTLGENISVAVELKNIGKQAWPVINLPAEKGTCFTARNVVTFHIKRSTGENINFHRSEEDYYPDEMAVTLKPRESLNTSCALNNPNLPNHAVIDEPGDYAITATYYGLGRIGYGTYRDDTAISNIIHIHVK